MIAMDFAKAFDKVSHKRLLYELDFYGSIDSWLSVTGLGSSVGRVSAPTSGGTRFGPGPRHTKFIFARLRIGHTRITHSYLLKREDQPKCIGCDTSFTVKHFLLECTDFAAKRISSFQANNLKELFKDVPVGYILPFLRQVNLFYKI